MNSRFVGFDKHSIKDLAKAKQMRNLADFRGKSVDTSDTHDKDDLVFCWDVKVTIRLGSTTKLDLRLLEFSVLFDVVFSTLEDDFLLIFKSLGLFNGSLLFLGSDSLVSLAFLEKVLWNGGESKTVSTAL